MIYFSSRKCNNLPSYSIEQTVLSTRSTPIQTDCVKVIAFETSWVLFSINSNQWLLLLCYSSGPAWLNGRESYQSRSCPGPSGLLTSSMAARRLDATPEWLLGVFMLRQQKLTMSAAVLSFFSPSCCCWGCCIPFFCMFFFREEPCLMQEEV